MGYSVHEAESNLSKLPPISRSGEDYKIGSVASIYTSIIRPGGIDSLAPVCVLKNYSDSWELAKALMNISSRVDCDRALTLGLSRIGFGTQRLFLAMTTHSD